MSIYKVNSNLNNKDKVEDINDMIIEVNGKVEQGKFDVNEVAQMISDLGIDRKYLRNQSLGHTLTTYTDWSRLVAEDGYSIWEITPTSYTYNSLNKLYFDDKLLSNKGEADSESATSFDKVYVYNGDSGAGYTDNSTEAATEEGTEFNLMDSTSDYLYVGSTSTFAGAKFEFQTRGSGYTLKVEYYNGSWTQLTTNTNSLSDDTSDFESNGRITWTIPSDWVVSSVESGDTNKYYIRISSTTTPVTTAEAYYIIPGDSVISLLALSSSEILNEDWAWCSYSTSIYVTIRNTGNSAYEGDYYITSSSSAANLQNFFVYNHEYKADYEDSTYSYVGISVTSLSSDLEMNGYNLNDVGVIYGSDLSGDTGYLRIGDAGTTNHSLVSEDDLMVTGKLEVKGMLYCDTHILMDDISSGSLEYAANQSGIFSDNGELFAIDANGNTTILSPHDSETGEWIFYSRNLKTGRQVRVNMEKMIRKIEILTGEKFLIEEYV